MTLEQIINDIVNQTLDVAKRNDENMAQDLVNIHVQAFNRLTGYDDDGNKGDLPKHLNNQSGVSDE